MLNEMWMKCSGLSYFSFLIAWAAGSSFCLLGINGWYILILFIWKRLSGVFHTSFYFFFFFPIWGHMNTLTLQLPPWFSQCIFFQRIFSGLYSHHLWSDCLLVMETFSQPTFSSCIYHFSGRELRVSPKLQRKPVEVGVPSCSLSLDVTQTSMAPGGVSPLPPLAALAKLPQWSMAWIFQHNHWILQL